MGVDAMRWIVVLAVGLLLGDGLCAPAQADLDYKHLAASISPDRIKGALEYLDERALSRFAHAFLHPGFPDKIDCPACLVVRKN